MCVLASTDDSVRYARGLSLHILWRALLPCFCSKLLLSVYHSYEGCCAQGLRYALRLIKGGTHLIRNPAAHGGSPSSAAMLGLQTRVTAMIAPQTQKRRAVKGREGLLGISRHADSPGFPGVLMIPLLRVNRVLEDKHQPLAGRPLLMTCLLLGGQRQEMLSLRQLMRKMSGWPILGHRSKVQHGLGRGLPDQPTKNSCEKHTAKAFFPFALVYNLPSRSILA